MAEEVYRIEIPVTVEDRTEPSLSNAEKKVSRFDQIADRTRKRLDQMNRTRWQLAIHVLDRASAMINRIGALARRVASSSYRITVSVLDMATSPFRTILRGMNSALGILGIGAGTAGGIVVPLKMVMQQQNIETAFEVLLGDAAAAKKRVEELTTFAGTTPYTRDEIYEASRVLQVFTGNALSTGEGLRLVGDIAAGTQKEFGDVALWMGRLYDAMASGRPVGEMTSALQEMGAISGAARERLEKLADSGMDISKTWPKAVQEFARFDGMMSKLSDNLANLLLGVKSFFMNNIIKRWGQGLTDGITPLLQSFRQWRKENAEGIARMGDQVEKVASRFTRYFVDKVQVMTRNLRALFHDEQFKNADLFGKVKIAWDKIISEPFASWWAGGGKERVDSIAASIGGALGAGLNSVLLGLLGMGTDAEAKISDSPFVEAGASAGRSFLEAFLEAFDAGKIAQKAKEAFLNLQPTWLGGETSSPVGQSLALMMDAWLITKVGKLLKGPFKLGRGLVKGGRSISQMMRGDVATTAAATAATASDAVRQVPWYRRIFGGGKTPIPSAADSIPSASSADLAKSTANLKTSAASFREAINKAKEAELAVQAAEKARHASQTKLNETVKQYKQLTKQSADAAEAYRRFGTPIPAGLDKKVTEAKKAVEAARSEVITQSRKVSDLKDVAKTQQLRVDQAREVFATSRAAVTPVLETAETALPKQSWWKRLLGGSKEMGLISRVAGKAALPLGIGLDALSIASARPGEERNRAIGGTVGSWGGFTAGAAGGAALGSIIPGLGTAVGGLIGGILGSLGGGAIGEWLGGQFDQLGDIARDAWDGVKRIAGDTWNWISDTAPQAIARGIGFAVGYIDSTLFSGDWWNEKWSAVEAWSDASWKNAEQTWNDAISAIEETIFNGEWWNEKWKGVEDWANNTWADLEETWNNARDSIDSTLFNGDWWKEKWRGVESWAHSSWENIKGKWGSFWSKVSSAFSEGKEAGQAAAAGGAKAYARGGFITRPHFGLVGEAGPEAIIPLSPGMRNRGRELWEQAGQMLGVRPFAFGGIVGSVQAPAFGPVAPLAPSGTGLTINLGGVHFSITVEGNGEDVIEAIREHGDEIADEIAEKIGARLEGSTDNSV